MDEQPTGGVNQAPAGAADVFVPPLDLEVRPVTGTALDTPRLASLGDRLVALLIDGFLALGVYFLLGMYVAGLTGGDTSRGFNLEGLPAAGVIVGSSLLIYFYLVVLELSFGATLGKFVAGAQVRTTDGHRIGGRAALVRNLFRILDSVGLYLLGGLVALFTKRRQRLGDLAAGTIVVQRDWSRGVRATALVLAVVLGFAGIIGGLVSRPTALSATPRFTRVVLTDNPSAPIGREVFAPTTQTFYILFTVADVPDNTTLRVNWIAEQVANEPPNLRIDDAQVIAGGERNQGQFSLARSSFSWPAGTYRAELFIAGALSETVRFRVDPSAGPPANGAPASPTAALR